MWDVERGSPGFDICDERISAAHEEIPMRYLILIYQNPQSRRLWESFSDEGRAAGLHAYAVLNEELAASGELLAAEALADPDRAKHVTRRDGKTIASDGPFAEVKEQLAGFYLVECASLDRAIEIAGRIPEAELGMLEVRPIMTYAGLEM
jgi:hypothetical protein